MIPPKPLLLTVDCPGRKGWGRRPMCDVQTGMVIEWTNCIACDGSGKVKP